MSVRPRGRRVHVPAERSAGILLHPTSLPGPFASGDLGPVVSPFLAWMERAGQTLWQVLPLGPTGPGDSPYGGTSAFAGNPLLVSQERLVEEGWLAAGDLAGAPGSGPDAVDFEAAAAWSGAALRAAWERFGRDAGEDVRRDLARFVAAREQRAWLSDWTLFSAAKRARDGAAWLEWEPALAARLPASLENVRRDLAAEIAFEEFVQFLFFRQWSAVHDEARRRGIQILGDVPIYVAHDSADVWAHRELFALDAAGLPITVAGVPPDYFSETGQLWGYPVYDWKANARQRYRWWIERLRANLRLADLVRLDHFRGFAAFWEVPAGETTAIGGRWTKGPGKALFTAAKRALGGGALPFVAEDLGSIDPPVLDLLDELGIPGMKVLQFAFSEDDSPHLPHRHGENALVYTGTHDNDTTRGWAAALSPVERARLLSYAGGDLADPVADLIRLAYTSPARRAIVPLQDVFGLGSEARMNTPGRAAGNWRWRARGSDFTDTRAEELRRLAVVAGRHRRIPSPAPSPAPKNP
jgi:4-alpha-glucanotransferase